MAYKLEEFITYLLLGVSLFTLITTQIRVTSSYKKYKIKKTKNGLTGCEIARDILDSNGLSKVYVVVTNGIYSNYYDFNRKVLKLSYDVFHGDSIAALSIAAHACSSAIQDKNSNKFVEIRARIMPFVNFLIYLGYGGIIVSILAGVMGYLKLFIAILLIVFLFHLLTLTIEKEISKITLKQIEELSFVQEEKDMIRDMLESVILIPLTSIISLIIYPVQKLFSSQNK